MSLSSDLLAIAQRAQQSSIALATAGGKRRSTVIAALAEAIHEKQDDILEANTLDLEASREMAVPNLVLDWLKLTPERIHATVQVLEQLGMAPDPLHAETVSDSSVEHCDVYGLRSPVGTIALVYESFPELAAIAAGFCLRTGNVLLLKGGSEAAQTNQVITHIVQDCLAEADLPQSCIQLIPSEWGDVLRELVTLDPYIHLIIPYGRASLVQQVLKQATVPVLRTSIGNCYLFWSISGPEDLVKHIILDSHQSEPDPVNAVEKVLVHRGCSSGSLASLFADFKAKGLKLKGDSELVSKFPGLAPMSDAEWHQPFLNKTVAFRFVDGVDEAIAWINQHSNGHADCIVTDSYRESRQFVMTISSASVYVNTSPRFYRYPQEGNPVALGMSNQRGTQRGLIGLDALTMIKRVVQGNSSSL
ncbi:MAG: glutamate-5-semialdehyde dehydrogenase [Elainellaceae cyanobacterium]